MGSFLLNPYFYGGIEAIGGLISYVGNYKVHTFYSSEDFQVISGSGEVEYLIVGGGGAGGCGWQGGGGGGGAVITGNTILSTQIYPVVIGNGGTSSQILPTSGSNSSFNGIIATGGGYGSYEPWGAAGTVGSGGSGGGGSHGGSINPGTGISGQGNNGGYGHSTTNNYVGGGGGGYSAVGTNASSTVAGNGGNGYSSSINGFTTIYGSGGGGSRRAGGTQGTGGTNGGNGGLTRGTSGRYGTGSGGGAGANLGSTQGNAGTGGFGSSGAVIIRYLFKGVKKTITNFGSYYGYSDGTYASSALEYKFIDSTTPDGIYRINLPTVGNTDIYCLMNDVYDGGGWMMCLKATRGTTFSYASSHWTTTSTLNTTQLNRNDGDAKFNSFNYYQGRDLMALWPDIATNGGSFIGANMWSWLQLNYPSYIGQKTCTPLYLFSNANRTFIQDAKTYSGWASGVFSSQVDIRFYGFNWTDNVNCRWGFGWNENGGGLYPYGATGSDDVSGGIGMSSGTYSAGDRITCCQDTTGINRSARVEIYVR